MAIDASRVFEMLVGLADVDVLGADDSPGVPLVVTVAPRQQRRLCVGCRTEARGKDHRMVDLCDLASFGRRVVLRVWRTRWCCSDHKCGVGSWTFEHPEIAPARHALRTFPGSIQYTHGDWSAAIESRVVRDAPDTAPASQMTLGTLECDQTYRFRVAALGDGKGYAKETGAWSSTYTAYMPACGRVQATVPPGDSK